MFKDGRYLVPSDHDAGLAELCSSAHGLHLPVTWPQMPGCLQLNGGRLFVCWLSQVLTLGPQQGPHLLPRSQLCIGDQASNLKWYCTVGA